MIQVIGVMFHLAAAIIHHFHCQGARLQDLLYVLFSRKLYHGAVIPHLDIMECIFIRMGNRGTVNIWGSGGDHLELYIHIYLPMDDPPAIFAAEKAVIAAVLIVPFYFRKRKPLIIDLDAFSGQDPRVPGYFPPKYLRPVFFHEAIIRRIFHLVVIIECPIVDVTGF